MRFKLKELAGRGEAVYVSCGNPAQHRSQHSKLLVTMCAGMLATPEWLASGGKLGLAVRLLRLCQQRSEYY